MGAGLVAYDALAGKAGLGKTQFLGREATLKQLPTARAQGLKGGVKYWTDNSTMPAWLLATSARLRPRGAAGELLPGCRSYLYR